MPDEKKDTVLLPHEMDELTEYVFRNYSSVLTPNEFAATKALFAERKVAGTRSEKLQILLRKRYGLIKRISPSYSPMV